MIINKLDIILQFIKQNNNMNLKNTNWLAVITSVIAGGALGYVLYGLLFLDIWAAGNSITINLAANEMTKNGVIIKPNDYAMLFNALSTFIYALLMNWLLIKTNMCNLKGGLTIGLVIGSIMFIGIITGNLFAENPISLSLLDGGCSLLLWLIIGAIMGGWRKR